MPNFCSQMGFVMHVIRLSKCAASIHKLLFHMSLSLRAHQYIPTAFLQLLSFNQSGQPHRKLCTHKQEIFSCYAAQYNSSTIQKKWPTALFCIQTTLGVCVHQWEGDEAGKSDGEERGKTRGIKACTLS